LVSLDDASLFANVKFAYMFRKISHKINIFLCIYRITPIVWCFIYREKDSKGILALYIWIMQAVRYEQSYHTLIRKNIVRYFYCFSPLSFSLFGTLFMNEFTDVECALPISFFKNSCWWWTIFIFGNRCNEEFPDFKNVVTTDNILC
jgi:hypothetical protein